MLALGALSVWAATLLQPGTFLPPLSWPILSACMHVALLHRRRRLDVTDKLQAAAGLASAATLLVFLLQDGEFTGWGDVYYFCGRRQTYCTCGYRWNLAGWGKAIALWSYVLTTAMGVQRLLIQLVLQGLLPGEEVVMRDSLISICWRLIPYWLNAWELQWGAECSSMTFELPQYAVELLVILPCVQVLCSRMKVLAMPSVNAALPRGWDRASAEQIQHAFVPNVQRGCWERRPEQKCIWQRLKANRPVTAFAALLCLMACCNALFVPLHLEDTVLRHPRTAGMQVAGRLPLWGSTTDLGTISNRLQQGSLNLTQSFVTQKAVSQFGKGKRGSLWRRPADHVQQVDLDNPGPADVLTVAVPAAARHRGSSSFASWVAAVEQGPWQHNSSWAAAAVDGLRTGLQDYRTECPRSDAFRFKHNAWKHHLDIFRMQDPAHRGSIPLIEAALAVMRLSSEKLFVLLSLYVAFLLFRVPPPQVARLIGINARISNAFARLVLYSFPCICWCYGAGFVFSTLVSLVFWGGPLWQVYIGLRTHACTVSVKGLRPATAAEIERMHNDCAICWMAMTVPGAAQHSTAAPEDRPAEAAAAAASAAVPDAGAVAQLQGQAPLPAVAGTGGVVGAARHAAAEGPGDSDGSTLPCGHCYHQTCLTQWLQQCHAQGTAPTCPMCQARMELAVKWHVLKALLAPEVWQLPARRRGRLDDEGLDGVEQQQPAAAQVLLQPHNNYLLRHNPRLAELLVDMQQLLAPENVQLLADVQELRWQRQQLVNELQLRQQQLQQLEGRHQQLEMRLELQRQQLLGELQLLAQQLAHQRQQQEQQRQREQHMQEHLLGRLPQVQPVPDGGEQQQAQQQEGLLGPQQGTHPGTLASQGAHTPPTSAGLSAGGPAAANNTSSATARGAVAGLLDAGSSRAVGAAGQCPSNQGSAGAGAGNVVDNSGQLVQEQPQARRRCWFGRRA